MFNDLESPLPVLVKSKYTSAKASSSLTFASSELAIIRTKSGLPFQLRYCPSLAKKPNPQKDEAKNKPKEKSNPFENPEVELFITDIPKTKPTHFLVLNKFPIIKEHFILATKLNKAQTQQLEEEDLAVAHACLGEWENYNEDGKERRLFAFFNSGEHSGASQAHRHLQFLPVESMKEDETTGEWELLMDRIVNSGSSSHRDDSVGDTPFASFWDRIPKNPSSSQLLDIYNRLYEQSATAVESYIRSNPSNLELHDTKDGSSPFSYNLGMTNSAMFMCPRRREGIVLRRDNGSEIGFVALNGTILAGTLMVKREEEWQWLQENPSALEEVLRAVGIPPIPSQGVATKI